MLTPLASLELDDSRLGNRVAFDLVQNLLDRLVIRQVAAAIHETVAHSRLQRDTPLPAGFPRDRTCVWNGWSHRFRLHRYGTVARQVVRPVVIARVQGLLDQQSAEAGAIDEKIAVNDLA